ncbi:acylthioesterase ii [Phialemonium atrogriseum]|uniref:Acylthioesterase ii n=1 Tax=Phialemonium atrogriseum TaxID=1093897 RepID=A0AAJ0FJD4_9PEZI|nr:acylthioesterase ii [Phialemonium atrogriseum]KAK1764294.1 acylthioesterase ii [Phialemonium atrogriseum]
MASTLLDQVSVEESGPDQFVSRFNPGRMGNTANIAYGGCTLAAAVQAACRTVSPEYLLYSTLGNYLGPALTDRKLTCSVRRVRDTRTFATRQVEVSQEQQDGAPRRLCMVVLADFQVREPASLLAYSAPPSRSYSPVERCLGAAEAGEEMVRSGVVPRKLVGLHGVIFGLMARFFETRQAPEGVSAQNLGGLAKGVRTDQDDLPITSKTSADWFRCRHRLDRREDHHAGLAFVMDGALSFMPLTHSGMFVDDVAACSSLDFALRFFTGDVDLNNWHLRELKTVAGGEGRTYTESRLWDQSGTLVASMTQQSILRPKRTAKPAL